MTNLYTLSPGNWKNLPIHERIVIEIFGFAFAYITITSKFAKIFQILINFSQVIFLLQPWMHSSEFLNCHFQRHCVEMDQALLLQWIYFHLWQINITTINIDNLKVLEHFWVDFISSLSSKHGAMQFSLQANLISLWDLKFDRLDWHYASLVSVGLDCKMEKNNGTT